MKWIAGVSVRSLQPGDHLDRAGKKPTREDMFVKVEDQGDGRVIVEMGDGDRYPLSGEMVVPIWRPDDTPEVSR